MITQADEPMSRLRHKPMIRRAGKHITILYVGYAAPPTLGKCVSSVCTVCTCSSLSTKSGSQKLKSGIFVIYIGMTLQTRLFNKLINLKSRNPYLTIMTLLINCILLSFKKADVRKYDMAISKIWAHSRCLLLSTSVI